MRLLEDRTFIFRTSVLSIGRALFSTGAMGALEVTISNIIAFFRFSKQDINNRVASFRTLLLRQPYNPSIRENNNGSDER